METRDKTNKETNDSDDTHVGSDNESLSDESESEDSEANETNQVTDKNKKKLQQATTPFATVLTRWYIVVLLIF